MVLQGYCEEEMLKFQYMPVLLCVVIIDLVAFYQVSVKFQALC